MHGIVASAEPSVAAPAVRAAPELAIVVPTFKERENVPRLVARLRALLAGHDWEAIFVDDNSPDGTAELVRQIGEGDRRIRCIRRIGRRGLAGACLEGMLATQARYVAVMDADLQHDETVLLPMLEKLRSGTLDLVVATRYAEDGSAASFGRRRAWISNLGTRLARLVTGVELSDPMSGFFMMRRELVEELAPRLTPEGFKILFDIVATARGRLRIAEIPFVFGVREQGESKLDARVAVEYAALVIAKLTGGTISFRFLLFCLVGLTGVGVHLSLLHLALAGAGLRFAIAQTAATFGAICWNFALNNALTYRDQRLTGGAFAAGLLRFQVTCGVGAIANIGVASWIYAQHGVWWVAGLAGALMGAVWNYMVSSAWVWKARA